ncbi:CPBP family intramembrane glutamic endopeptidase [Xanthomonas sacchari]|uniref:CPBP family intramembrane glutamic endopeptidase n=1 Tax=Xanthomonas sacchari TaxID=56458 RepID=UPI001FC9DD1C|nr:type II CAAX endopeptidase family protein [Xanthomonas sacchari]
MAIPTPRQPMSTAALVAVLLGFPLGSFLLSLLLLQRPAMEAAHWDAQAVVFFLAACWYAIQIALLRLALKQAGWSWRDIGWSFGGRGTAWLIAAYLVAAFALIGGVEWALAHGPAADPAQLSDLANLTPRTLQARLIYVVMGLLGGLCEELVYRGFALQGLRRRGAGIVGACLLASLAFVAQHGLKSLSQFGWFFTWGLVFCVLFLTCRRLWPGLILHWLVILSALPAVLPH